MLEAFFAWCQKAPSMPAMLRIGKCAIEGLNLPRHTHSIKKATGLQGLGVLKHDNYDLTIRWMYVLSI